MIDWFGPGDFLPRVHCGDWGSLAVWSQLVNVAIACAYMYIPFTLLRHTPRLRFTKSVPVICFALFIVACGTGHICDALAFHWPAYRTFFIVDTATALLSGLTAATCPLLAEGLLSGR